MFFLPRLFKVSTVYKAKIDGETVQFQSIFRLIYSQTSSWLIGILIQLFLLVVSNIYFVMVSAVMSKQLVFLWN